ncbi:MAG: hypothetical protein NWF03_03695 [Candidatus Bathyarchaeota archaeon]|nr:hypothetical protein [Candidatus Bathyarchaeota archaeon]
MIEKSSTRILTGLAFLTVLLGYALPWWQFGVTALIVNVKLDIYIWGATANWSGLFQQSEQYAVSWFQMLSTGEDLSEYLSAGGLSFLLSLMFYIVSTIVLLIALGKGKKNARFASGGLLTLALLLFISGTTQITSSSMIPLNTSYTIGTFLCIISIILTVIAGVLPNIQWKQEIDEDTIKEIDAPDEVHT